MFDGNTVSGIPRYTQTGVSLTGSGFSSIVLNGAFRVAQGHQYTFTVDEGSRIGYSYKGPPNESAWFFSDPSTPDEFEGLSIGHRVYIAKLYKV